MPKIPPNTGDNVASLAGCASMCGVSIARASCFAAAMLLGGSAYDRAAARGSDFENARSEHVADLGLASPPLAKKVRPPAILLAHAIIVRTSPAQGGVAAADIGKVDVWYDAGIRDSLTALAVVGESGDRVDKRDAAIDSADPAHVSVSVNSLAPGKYIVRYRALSADGHLVSGAWDFEVRP